MRGWTMKLMMTVAAICLLAAPGSAAAQGTKYGEGVKLSAATPLGTLLENPDAWIGKKVRVDGVVTNVCEMAGCWMELSDEKTGKGIRFKVEDGVIVFPLTAKGHRASAEGTFELVQVTPEQQKKHEPEKAKQKEHAEHAEHGAGTGGPTYQIRATGAIVY